MRKMRYLVFFGLLGVSFWMAWHWGNLPVPKTNSRHSLEIEPAAIGTKDDPEARERYERLRLQNPTTGQVPADIREREMAFAASLPTKESLAMSLGKVGDVDAIQAATWSARGPMNVGGRTRALAADATNANILLAGGVSGGMWRSTNGGASWTKTTAAAALHSVTCVAQDTRSGKTNIWYYGTGEYRGNSAGGGGAPYSGDGVFKSTNGGVSWTQLPATVSGTPQTFDQMFDYVWTVVTDPSNLAQDEVYAATYGGILRSTDGGASWAPVLGGAANTAGYVDVAITTTGVVYATLNSAGATKGIWRSADGTNWFNITPAGWPATYRRIVIGIAPSNQNVVYFLAETPGSGLNGHSFWKYTYVSGDGTGAGGTWVNRSANLPAYGGLTGNYDSQGSYDMVAKVKPDDEHVVFIGGTNLYRSTDGFATTPNTKWIGGYNSSNVDYSLYANHHPDQHAIAFSPTSAITMFSGHDGGVSKTTNNFATSVAWTSLSNGYMTSQFYAVAIDHATSGNKIIIGGTQDNGTWFTNSTVASTPWVQPLGGDGSFCAIADGRTSYYGSFQNGVVYRLLIDDATGNYTQWTRVDPMRPGGSAAYLFINPFLLDANTSNIMYLAGGDRVWRNSDLTAIPLFSNSTTSTNWTALTNTVVNATVTALGISRTPANRLYYGTHNGQVYRVDGANVGNPGRTDVWTGKGFPAGAYISCIAVDPNNADRALVVFSNYEVVSLFYTSNGGTSWTAVAGNLEQFANGSGNGPSGRWASILPTGFGTTYLVGTSTGLYSTTSLSGAATVWATEGATTIGNVVVDMIDTRRLDRLAVVGTHGRGVFSAQIPSIKLLFPPKGLIASFIGKIVRLNWQAPTADDSLTLMQYNVYRSVTSPVEISPQNKLGSVKAPGRTFDDTTSAHGKSYFYMVTAVYSQGESDPSNQIEAQVPEGTITVSSPAAAVTWPTGSQRVISWSSSQVSGNVHLKLSTNGGASFPVTLAANRPNDGVDTVNVPNSPSATCRVLVQSVLTPSITGANPGNFTIMQQGSPTITVNTPAAGATWAAGSSQTISWTTNGVAENVKIKLSTDGGATFPVTLSSSAPNIGAKTIIVPNVSSAACRVRVEAATNSAVFGNNPGNFAIILCPLSWQVNLSVKDGGAGKADLSLGQGPNATNSLDPPCGEVELYPTPPSGVFDARFELPLLPVIASLKDFRNDSVQAPRWRIRFQAGIGPITFAWNRQGFPAGYFLRDEINGTLVNVNVKNDSTYTLTNTAVTSLRIGPMEEYICRNVSVTNGWNIISVPLAAANMAVNRLFPNASSSAYSYSNGYVETSMLQNGRGYWVKFNGGKIHSICGSLVSPKTIPVNPGWNLIGPFDANVPIANIISQPNGIVSSGYFGYGINGFLNANTLLVGKGYWVRVKQAGLLSIGAAVKSAQMVESSSINNSWPQIVITDANGQTATLYLAPAGELDASFDLPPTPPQGIFDIRFSSDRFAESLEDGRHEIQINSANYPIRITTQNFADKELNIRDLLGGEVVNETLTAGKEITIVKAVDRLALTSSALPTNYALSQNAPNPFNPSTIIKFALPAKAHVKISVYNIKGEQVAELLNEEKPAGHHQVQFNAQGRASGVYFYVMEAGAFRELKKMMFVK